MTQFFFLSNFEIIYIQSSILNKIFRVFKEYSTQRIVYVYQCTPHLILGMIGVIQVGEAVNLNEVKANVGKLTFAVNPERLSNYLNLVE